MVVRRPSVLSKEGRDMKRWDKVEIFWEDSHQIHGWVALSDSGFEEDNSLGHMTVGYYIGETPNQITVCQSKKSDAELDQSPDTAVNAVFSIPKVAIKRINKIGVNHEKTK